MKFRLTMFMFLLTLSSLYAQGGRMNQDTTEFFSAQYDDPVIEKIHGSHETVFRSLTFYRVFDKKNLVEDPLIPDVWIRTSTGQFFSAGNIELALKEDRICPGNAAEALAFAKEIVRIKHDCYYFIEGTVSFDETIPEVYNKLQFYPSAERSPNGYIVRLYAYYPDRRYAEFFSLYREVLVEYIVSYDGMDYSVETGQVYRDGIPDDDTVK